MDCDVLTLSGLWNSGPEHWQTHWERKHPEFVRVPHRDYNNPVRDEWVEELDAAIAASDGPPILVAHSLGVQLVVQWARSQSDLKIAGALLVAPSDTEAPSYPVPANGFAPVPLDKLPFPTIVAASSNDPFVSPARARQFADAWGSQFVALGDLGHINGDSNLGDWPAGAKLLEQLCAQVPHDA